jgi:hypothetical protein
MTLVFTTLTRSHSAILIDLSRTGARLSGEDLPEEAEYLTISLGGMRVFGTIAWCHGGECGVTFEEVLSEANLRLLGSKAAKVSGASLELKAAFDDWNNGFAR